MTLTQPGFLSLQNICKHVWQTRRHRSHNFWQDQAEEDGDSREKHIANQRKYVPLPLLLIQSILVAVVGRLFGANDAIFFFLLAAIEQEKTESSWRWASCSLYIPQALPFPTPLFSPPISWLCIPSCRTYSLTKHWLSNYTPLALARCLSGTVKKCGSMSAWVPGHLFCCGWLSRCHETTEGPTLHDFVALLWSPVNAQSKLCFFL